MSPAEPPAKSGDADGVIPPNWDRRLTLGLLRREAERLIQGERGASATCPEPEKIGG